MTFFPFFNQKVPWKSHSHFIKNVSKALHFRTCVSKSENVIRSKTARNVFNICQATPLLLENNIRKVEKEKNSKRKEVSETFGEKG